LFHEKLRSLKIPQDLLVLWKNFVPFFSVGCTLLQVCSSHHLPLRFDTQVPNMMRITIVQKLKVAQIKKFAPRAVKVYCPYRA
jgi:hypothetical protein